MMLMDEKSGPRVEYFAWLGAIAASQRPRCLALAAAEIRRLHLDPALIAPDDAVNGALLRLCQRLRKGTGPPIDTIPSFHAAFKSVLGQVLVDQWRHDRARMPVRAGTRKDARWGGATFRFGDLAARSRGTLLDIVDPRDGTPGEPTEDEDCSRALLDRVGPELREIIVLRLAGLSNAEVAARLRMSRRTVKRRLQEARQILGPYLIGKG